VDNLSTFKDRKLIPCTTRAIKTANINAKNSEFISYVKAVDTGCSMHPEAAAGAMNLKTAVYTQHVVHDTTDTALNLLTPAMCANFTDIRMWQ